MKSASYILAIVFLLQGCESLSSNLPKAEPTATIVCPHVYAWTPEQIKQLGAEDEKLSANSMVHRAVQEGYDTRTQIKSACGGAHVPQ